MALDFFGRSCKHSSWNWKLQLQRNRKPVQLDYQ